MTIRGLTDSTTYPIKVKIMNQSNDLVDEIMSDGKSCRIENPRLITNKPLYRYLKSIPFGQRNIHDIRLRFESI